MEAAYPRLAVPSSCWGGQSPAPWPVFLSGWPIPWWVSGGEPQAHSHFVLVSQRGRQTTSTLGLQKNDYLFLRHLKITLLIILFAVS